MEEATFVQDATREKGAAVDLLPNVKAAFDAKKTCTSHYKIGWLTSTTVRKAVLGMMAVHRLQDGQQHGNTIGGQTPAEKEKLTHQVEQYKQEAADVSPVL